MKDSLGFQPYLNRKELQICLHANGDLNSEHPNLILTLRFKPQSLDF